jgi:DNA-3-methyladenine glycosylase II
MKRDKTPPPAPVLADQAAFEAALAVLATRDAAFVAEVIGTRGPPSLRRRAAGLEGLAWIVVSQQVSTASATAIFARLKARLGSIDADAIKAINDQDLRTCGLSAPKVRTLRAIAEAQAAGLLDFAALARAEAGAAHRTLVAIKGIGPWTADIFLLFCLGHADAWPAGDLALQEAAKLLLGLEVRPDAKALQAIGERWRPYRGVAAHCLWAYYTAGRSKPSSIAAAGSARGTTTEP